MRQGQPGQAAQPDLLARAGPMALRVLQVRLAPPGLKVLPAHLVPRAQAAPPARIQRSLVLRGRRGLKARQGWVQLVRQDRPER